MTLNMKKLFGPALGIIFVQVTKSQVAEILDSRGQDLVNNVEALLLAVKSTNDFEAEMARRFGGSISEDTEHEVGIRPPAASAVHYQPLFGPGCTHSLTTTPGSFAPCQINDRARAPASPML